MRVTRSKSANFTPSPLKAQTLFKVGKVNNTVSRISSSKVKSESLPDLIPQDVKNGFHNVDIKSETDEVPKSPASPSKARSKPHIEQAFAHIQTPPNLELPPSFISYHTPEFIDGINHVLKIDPSLYPAIVFGNFEAFARDTDDSIRTGSDSIDHYWYSLISSVISQQVSGSAAKAIKGRFKALFTASPTPRETLKIASDTLKAVGLSSMKLKYVVHISEVFSDPKSNLSSPEFYSKSSTEELIAELIKLKGIGEWSASMFAVFTLKELDIFAYDDLGVARGVARYLQIRPSILEETKIGVHAIEDLKSRLKKKSKFHSDKSKRDWTPIHDEYVKFLALKFEPYRTAFMLVMWRLSSTNIDALESTTE